MPYLGRWMTEQERNAKVGEYAGQFPNDLQIEVEERCEGRPLKRLS